MNYLKFGNGRSSFLTLFIVFMSFSDKSTDLWFWNILVRTATRYAPFITLPFAAVIGYIGYNLENILSDKYTPYNESIQDKRAKRLSSDDQLENATNIEKIGYRSGVLETNLPPSLKKPSKENVIS